MAPVGFSGGFIPLQSIAVPAALVGATLSVPYVTRAVRSVVKSASNGAKRMTSSVKRTAKKKPAAKKKSTVKKSTAPKRKSASAKRRTKK